MCPFIRSNIIDIKIHRLIYTYNSSYKLTVSEEELNLNIVGCFEDTAENRTLSEFRVSLDFNSPKRCIYICRQLGYAFAGVENV